MTNYSSQLLQFCVTLNSVFRRIGFIASKLQLKQVCVVFQGFCMDAVSAVFLCPSCLDGKMTINSEVIMLMVSAMICYRTCLSCPWPRSEFCLQWAKMKIDIFKFWSFIYWCIKPFVDDAVASVALLWCYLHVC